MKTTVLVNKISLLFLVHKVYKSYPAHPSVARAYITNIPIISSIIKSKRFNIICIISLLCNCTFSQPTQYISGAEVSLTASEYKINDTLSYLYSQSKPFSFVKNAAYDLYYCPKKLIRKNNALPALAITASTALLMYFDDDLINGSKKIGNYIGVPGTNNTKRIFKYKLIDIYVPTDISSGLYYIGDGMTELTVDAGFYIYGLITKDARALKTASELSEGLIAVGLTVQLLKHASGRQSPFKATEPGGHWQILPGWNEYYSSVPAFDAFPSGHLMTAMMTTTIIASNYPEYTFIKPLCYSLMALCGFQMMNNGVHWASDYPLALALGYTFGRFAADRGREIVTKHNIKKNRISDVKISPTYFGNQSLGLSINMTF